MNLLFENNIQASSLNKLLHQVDQSGNMLFDPFKRKESIDEPKSMINLFTNQFYNYRCIRRPNFCRVCDGKKGYHY